MTLIILLQENTPKITDWISAIGVLLGIPVTIYSIFKLFRKDKEQERKINSLETIAIEQNNVVKQLKAQADQLVIHSSHFQHQASLMKASNDLFERQLSFQMDNYFEMKGNEEEKLKIEKQRRINEIRPDFRNEGSSTGPDGFKLNLQNLGERAENVAMRTISTEHVNFRSSFNGRTVDKNNILSIFGVTDINSPYSALEVPFEIQIEYSDVDGNSYFQKIRKGTDGSYFIGDPTLKKE